MGLTLARQAKPIAPLEIERFSEREIWLKLLPGATSWNGAASVTERMIPKWKLTSGLRERSGFRCVPAVGFGRPSLECKMLKRWVVWGETTQEISVRLLEQGI